MKRRSKCILGYTLINKGNGRRNGRRKLDGSPQLQGLIPRLPCSGDAKEIVYKKGTL